MKKLLWLLVFSVPVFAQVIDPRTQINWPRLSGSGSPVSAGFGGDCGTHFGQPYTDKTGNHFWICGASGWFQIDGLGNTTNFKHDGMTLGGAFAPVGGVQTYDYDETSPAADAGFRIAAGRFDSSTGKFNYEVPSSAPPEIQPVIVPPVSGQYIILYPTTCTANSDVIPRGTAACSADGTHAGLDEILVKFPSSFPPVNLTSDFSGFALPSSIPAANVTSVYAFGVTSMDNPSGPGLLGASCSSSTIIPSGKTNWALQQVTTSTGITGATISSVHCGANWTNSGANPAGDSIFTASAIGLIVYYTGTPVPLPNALNVAWPLTMDFTSNTLKTDPLFPYWLNVLKVSDLGVAPNTGPYTVTPVRDGANSSDCSSGSGSTFVLCTTTDGVTYTALAGGGGVTGVTNSDGTLTISPTTGAVVASLNLAHANIWTAKQTQPAPLLSDITGSTQCLHVDATGQVSGTGSDCGAGGGGVGGSGTAGWYALWTASTTLGNGNLDDGITTASTITAHEAVNVVCTGCPTQVGLTYNVGHAPAGSAGSAVVAPDTTGNLDVNENNTGFARVCTATNGVCAGGGGGYTNVTGTASQTTVAALNSLCGSGTLYITTPLSIATGGTITCPTQFSKAGLMTVASGQTVTFAQPVKQTDAPSQIFAGSGTVVFAKSQVNPVIDWFGAVNYTSASAAAAGTDSLAAIQACITATTASPCLVPAGYYRVTGTVTVNKSNVGLIGATDNGFMTFWGSANIPYPSALVSTAASADIIDAAGVSSVNMIYGNVFTNLQLMRSVAPSGTATGLSLSYMSSAIVQYNTSADSIRGFYLKDATSSLNGAVANNTASWGEYGVTYGTVSLYGFYMDNAIDSEFSLRMSYNTAENLTHQGGTSYGFYLNGPHAVSSTDVMGDHNESAGTNYGVYVNQPGIDFQWNNSIDDSNTTACIYVTGAVLESTTSFDGGWCNTLSGSYGVDIESSNGVSITHKQFFHNASTGATTATVYVHSSAYVDISHNNFAKVPVTAILVDGSSVSNFNSNRIVTVASGAKAISFVNTSLANNVTGNSMGASGVASSNPAINFDATSANNVRAQDNTMGSGAFTSLFADANGSNNTVNIVVDVNSSAVANPNLNDTTPSVAGTTGVNNKWQVSGSSVSSYTPVATSSVPGVVKPDGTTCTVSSGVLTCTGSAGATSIPICTPASASGTAYTCTTSPSFTPVAGSVIAFKPDVSNSGTSATLNVNSSSAAPLAKWQNVTTLAANDFRAGSYTVLTFDGTNWEAQTIGNAPTSTAGMVRFAQCVISGTSTTFCDLAVSNNSYTDLEISVTGGSNDTGGTTDTWVYRMNSDAGSTSYNMPSTLTWNTTSTTTNAAQGTMMGTKGQSNDNFTCQINGYTLSVLHPVLCTGAINLFGTGAYGGAGWSEWNPSTPAAITTIRVFLLSGSAFTNGTVITLRAKI